MTRLTLSLLAALGAATAAAITALLLLGWLSSRDLDEDDEMAQVQPADTYRPTTYWTVAGGYSLAPTRNSSGASWRVN